jgi:phosphoadenosine phosphosulfate reductase
LSHDGSDLARFREETDALSPAALLRWAAERFSRGIAFASSLGAEDQVITAIIASDSLQIPIFTLDTGRMFNESYDLMARTEERLGIRIEPYFPDAGAVESMVREHGINLFYESVENRKLCCHIRKVEPLRRALAGRTAWVTGIRREQAATRAELEAVEWDAANGLYKINPLIDWTEDDVWSYIRDRDIPYNKLHDKGFRSIGCAPCTRAVKAGEDTRAGRWWWESPDHKECGLHPEEPTPGTPAIQVNRIDL